MSIGKYESTNPGQIIDPGARAYDEKAALNARMQSPFWQMFSAGGSTPAATTEPTTDRISTAATITPPRPPVVVAPPAVPAPRRMEEAAPPIAPPPVTPPPVTPPPTVEDDPVAAVKAALARLGIDSSTFNPRIDQNEIRFADRRYNYPLLRMELNGESVGFHLEGVMRDPMMTACNIAQMIGRPVISIPS